MSLDAVRDECDAALRKAVDSFRGHVHDALTSRMDDMRVALLRELPRVFAAMRSDAEADGVAFVIRYMLSNVSIRQNSRPKSVTTVDCAFNVIAELSDFFTAVGLRHTPCPPPPASPFHGLPDHLQEVILKKAANIGRDRDITVALNYAQMMASHYFNNSYAVEYHSYRFSTRWAAAQLGASELDATMPPVVNDWWGMLRVFMEFELMGLVCRDDAGTPCTPNNVRKPFCVVCSDAFNRGHRQLFVLFHNAFCDVRTLGPGSGRRFVANALGGFVRRPHACQPPF